MEACIGDCEVGVRSFADRIGVSEGDVVAVLLGLAENERMDRNHAMHLAGMLLACHDVLEERRCRCPHFCATDLLERVTSAIDAYEVPALR